MHRRRTNFVLLTLCITSLLYCILRREVLFVRQKMIQYCRRAALIRKRELVNRHTVHKQEDYQFYIR